LKVRKELGSKSLIGGSYMNIGNVYLEQKKYNESSRYLNKALSIVKEVGAMLGILECYKSLARLDSAQGNFARSLEHYKKYIAARDSVFGEEKTKKLKQVEFEQKELVARAEQEKKDDLALKELQRQKLIRNGLIIGMLLFAMVGSLLFRSWKLRKKMEKQHAIIQERMRISADLHDDIGSGLSQISLLSELVRQEVKTPEGKKEAEKIVSTSKNLLESMDEIIWALNANNDYIENLVSFIRRYAMEYFENSIVNLQIEFPENIPEMPISGEHRRNIYFAVKEAMHNIVKHSDATLAEIKFRLENRLFSVSIEDNGKGIPEGELNLFGNGIMNMRNRMKNIHGSCTIENNFGTKITLALPV
jgi:signal transduction histidine kinase